MPLISVLLPAKDAAPTLNAALRSTLRALPRDGEIVVLDDGSTDGTATVASGFRDARLRIVRNARSVGVGAAMQQLVDMTDSEFVARMDGDDVCFPGRFRSQIHDLRSGGDLAVTPAISFRTSPVRVRPELPLSISVEAMPLHLLIRNPLCHPSLTARRDALERTGGYRDVLAEDYDLWLRAVTRGLRLARSAVPLVGYRRHDRQMSAPAEFSVDAFHQPVLRQAYEDLVRERFHVEPTWLDALWRTGPDRPGTEGLDDLAALVDRHARRLSPAQRYVLGRTTRLLDARRR